MIAHVAPELTALAATCEVEQLPDASGWAIDRWRLDEAAHDALRDLYDALLLGGLEEEVEDALAARGVDAGALLRADDAARDRITRSDLTELLGAAAAIEIDGWPLETMHLPNVPKGSRKRSEVGIDVIAVSMDFDSDAVDLADDEMLYVGSVKHTIDDPGDLRYKLTTSISEAELTVPYVAQQLRVFHGRLAERGMVSSRIYLFLADFPDPAHVAITLTGAVDALQADDFANQMANLPAANGERRCRHLLVEAIGQLQDTV